MIHHQKSWTPAQKNSVNVKTKYFTDDQHEALVAIYKEWQDEVRYTDAGEKSVTFGFANLQKAEQFAKAVYRRPSSADLFINE